MRASQTIPAVAGVDPAARTYAPKRNRFGRVDVFQVVAPDWEMQPGRDDKRAI